jgi:acetyl-CoA synthetase
VAIVDPVSGQPASEGEICRPLDPRPVNLMSGYLGGDGGSNLFEAAVVPAPDPTRLAVSKAYISLAAGWAPDRATADTIFAHADRNLRPINASGALNPWNCLRPSPARSGVSNCGLAKTKRFNV